MNSSTSVHFFTVDVEEYFQVSALESAVAYDDWSCQESRVARSVDKLLGMLDRHNARGTFFVLGWVAEKQPQVVRAIVGAGHEVASHGFRHQRVTTLTQSAFARDVRESKDTIEQLIGTKVRGYRAPSFSIVPGLEWAFDTLIDEGYEYDSSLFPIRRPGYGYPGARRSPYMIERPRGSIAEFPLATMRLLNVNFPAAGGGYLRQLPLQMITGAFRAASQRGEHATFYIHPWELDPDQPRLNVSALTKVRHYRGLEKTSDRIEALLSEFRFTSIDAYQRSTLDQLQLAAAL